MAPTTKQGTGYVDAINYTRLCVSYRDHEDFTASYAALTEPKDGLDAFMEKRFAGPELATYMTSVRQTREGTTIRKGGNNESQRCRRYNQAVTQCRRDI